jgi:outer membrane murein-binding lipoprotein Lpp
MEIMSNDKKIQLKFLVGAIALMVYVFAMNGCSDEPEQTQKNRVPTVQAQVDQAQQAANDAKAAAASAQQTQKDIQAAVARLDNAGRNSDGSRKVGAPEVTAPGVVTSVGEAVSHEDSTTTTHTFYFQFAERGGFVKQFAPVCPNQSVPVNASITLNFHWHEYTSAADKGCYVIDGYTVLR